jgi:hypothetical protein
VLASIGNRPYTPAPVIQPKTLAEMTPAECMAQLDDACPIDETPDWLWELEQLRIDDEIEECYQWLFMWTLEHFQG